MMPQTPRKKGGISQEILGLITQNANRFDRVRGNLPVGALGRLDPMEWTEQEAAREHPMIHSRYGEILPQPRPESRFEHWNRMKNARRREEELRQTPRDFSDVRAGSSSAEIERPTFDERYPDLRHLGPTIGRWAALRRAQAIAGDSDDRNRVEAERIVPKREFVDAHPKESLAERIRRLLLGPMPLLPGDKQTYGRGETNLARRQRARHGSP